MNTGTFIVAATTKKPAAQLGFSISTAVERNVPLLELDRPARQLEAVLAYLFFEDLWSGLDSLSYLTVIRQNSALTQ